MAQSRKDYGENHHGNQSLICVPTDRTWDYEEDKNMSLCLMDPSVKADIGTI